MGPIRGSEENTSSFRFRFARYCGIWLVGLSLPLLLLIMLAPSIGASPAPFVVMLLYVGLPIGVGTALFGGIGFLAGGIWAALLENSTSAAKAWPKIKITLASILVAPVLFLALYLCISGLINLEVHAFSKNNHHMLAWASQPGWFIFNVLCWGGLAVLGSAAIVRALRKAYAT